MDDQAFLSQFALVCHDVDPDGFCLSSSVFLSAGLFDVPLIREFADSRNLMRACTAFGRRHLDQLVPFVGQEDIGPQLTRMENGQFSTLVGDAAPWLL